MIRTSIARVKYSVGMLQSRSRIGWQLCVQKLQASSENPLGMDFLRNWYCHCYCSTELTSGLCSSLMPETTQVSNVRWNADHRKLTALRERFFLNSLEFPVHEYVGEDATAVECACPDDSCLFVQSKWGDSRRTDKEGIIGVTWLRLVNAAVMWTIESCILLEVDAHQRRIS